MLMQSGDIILFKGEGVFSRLIMAAPNARFSHVGMYMHYEGKSCVFESTSLGMLPDVKTGELINGVQLTNFEERVASYKGSVYFRPILGGRSPRQLSLLEQFINKHHGKPYERSNWELANAQLDFLPWHENKEEDDSSLFCSETAAMALRDMGIMSAEGGPANEFTPTDFDAGAELRRGYDWAGLSTLKAA